MAIQCDNIPGFLTRKTLTESKLPPVEALEVLYEKEGLQKKCSQYPEFKNFQKAVALFWIGRAEVAWKHFRENVVATQGKEKGRYYNKHRKEVADLIRSAQIYLEGLPLKENEEKRLVFLKGIEEIIGD